MPQSVQVRTESPDFKLRNDVRRITHSEQRFVTINDIEQIQHRSVLGTNRWSGNSQTTDFPEQIHVTSGVFETGPAFIIVVDNPVGKTDRAFNRQPLVFDSFGKVRQPATLLSVPDKIFHPWLNSGITGLPNQVNLFLNR